MHWERQQWHNCSEAITFTQKDYYSMLLLRKDGSEKQHFFASQFTAVFKRYGLFGYISCET